MCIFKRKPKPSLIDLKEYSYRLFMQKAKGIPCLPPPAIPGGNFTEEEYELMEKNREIAQIIYEMAERLPLRCAYFPDPKLRQSKRGK